MRFERARTIQHRNSFGRQILLVGEVLVERQHNVEQRVGFSQQLAVLLAGPPTLDDGAALMRNQVPS
jgi:hypothetical protein